MSSALDALGRVSARKNPFSSLAFELDVPLEFVPCDVVFAAVGLADYNYASGGALAFSDGCLSDFSPPFMDDSVLLCMISLSSKASN